MREQTTLRTCPGDVDYADMDYKVSVEIGATPIRLRTNSPAFVRLLEDRYSGFLGQRPYQITNWT